MGSSETERPICRLPLSGRNIVCHTGTIDGRLIGSLVRLEGVLVAADGCDECARCGREAVTLVKTKIAWLSLCRTHGYARLISSEERSRVVADMVASGAPRHVVLAYWVYAVKRSSGPGGPSTDAHDGGVSS